MGFLKDLIGLMLAGAVSNVASNACDAASNALKTKLNKKQNQNDSEKFEMLKKLKELYDSGAITQREFNKKKKEILRR